MELHRATRKPDWLKRPARNYNQLQKIARQTNGIVTPGNTITVVGLLLTLYGLWCISQGSFMQAFIFVAIGRLCDIADGWVAHRTGTKSPVGEMLDASADKIATFVALVVLGVADIVPWWLLVAVAVPHALIAAIGFVANSQHRRLHPSVSGKLSMTLAWVGLGLFILTAWADWGNPVELVVRVAAYVLTLTSIAICGYAFAQYTNQLRSNP